MTKTLFEFDGGDVGESVREEPTCVVGEKQEICSRCKVQSVCLTSEKGYVKCADCAELAMVQETSSSMFPIKIFCKVEKCVRTA